MATPDLPNPQSYEQILADMLSAYAAKLGINDFNVGSVNTSFFEVVALATARASGDIFQILRDFSVDRATGDALKRLAQEYNVTPITASPSTGNVNIIDTSFTKISTKIYAGAPAPNIGSTVISISDASMFPSTGSVYLGRGTPNSEGPLPYTSPTLVGTFWTITLTSPTTRFHNLGESVILAQGGNRPVSANSIVLSPGIGSSPDIQYGVVTSAVVLDGETEVDNVQVTALIPGASGNVPSGSIKTFASPPFPGATVTNPISFTTGTDNETDDQLRVRIKLALASQGLGTATAVKASLIGASPSDENATIINDSLMVNTDGSATVFIDNGGIYEAKSNGVGLESIVDSALGGEQFFQLQTGGRQAPVAKAFLQSTIAQPFDLVGSDTLAVVVGGVTYQHVFQNSDFVSPGGATAYETAASINNDTTLGFEATTAGDGSFLVIRAKAETDDNIAVTVPTTSGRNAAVLLGFSSNTIETLRLYKNNIPLTKDGSTASVFSQAQQLWSPSIANGETLILAVDGTADITYTILDSDFINTGLYTFVSPTNSLASWIEVFNNKLTGVTATIVGQQIELTSNLGANNRASVVISLSSTLVTKGLFSSLLGLSSFGKASDFTLDRNTAQFNLTEPLVAGDVLSAGSAHTEATLTGASIPAGSVLLAADAHVWLLSDTAGMIIPTGVISNTLLSVSAPATNTIRYTTNVVNGFNNVLPGDYIIVWSTDIPSTDRIEGRVNAVTATTLDVIITPTEYAAITPVVNASFSQGFVIVRTLLAPQKFRVLAGNKTLDQIASELQTQTEGMVFSVFQEEQIVVSTDTMDSTGALLLVTADINGQLLELAAGSESESQTSLIAFYDTQEFEGQMPLFLHSTFATGTAANPIDSFITSVSSSVSLAGTDPNNLLGILNPYGVIPDAQPYGEYVQETTVSGTTIGIQKDPYIRRIRSIDRYFLASPLDFGFNDTAVVILDNNVTDETFTLPFYRGALTNTGTVSNPFNFNAYDVQAGPTTNFSSTFGPTFDFSNFKVLMQAKKVLKPTPPQTAILYRATPWGRSGEKITVGYAYPSAPNQIIGSSITVTNTVNIFISLGSGIAIPTSIDSSTQWNVTITANTPVAGIDQVTYTWNGVGSNPALTLSGGEYVNINSATGFNAANQGVFRVSTQGGFTPTATSFSVQRATGSAVAESNKATTVNNGIIFYNSTPTTAAQITAYVNANLAQYISATLVNDGGTSGSGIIAESTFEDSGFTIMGATLLDGINWLQSSNLSGSPQFTLKNPLALPTDVGYAFNNGETIRFSPTTMEQVYRFLSILAVTGFTTDGTVALVDRGSRVELATQILGSAGAIEVVGGTGNSYQLPILDAGANLDNQNMQVSVSQVASVGVSSDQWFRLQSSIKQIKVAGIDSNTDVTVFGGTPISNQSTIVLTGRSLTQRYFGKPRNNVRSQGDTFRVEKQGALVCISWNGIGTNPMFDRSLHFNDAGGGTVNITVVPNTNDAQYFVASGNANFTELSIGDLITVAGMTNPENNGTFLVTGVSDNGKTIQVTNPDAVTQVAVPFVAGNFSATGGVGEGDTVIFSAPFAVLNQGRFRVIRQYNNSIWIENPNVIEEEVTLPYNPVNLGFDGTTGFNVSASNNTLLLEWSGAGTEPSLGNATIGDVITLGTDFASGNRGSFMVLRSSVKLQQITELVMPGGPNFTLSSPGAYFKINTAGNAIQYYVWYNVNGTNSNPAPFGLVGVQVNILSGDTDANVASKTVTAINTSAPGLTATSFGNTVTITTVGFIETNPAMNATMPAPFSITTLQSATRTFLEAIDPTATSQGPVFVTNMLQDHRPQMQFWEYEAAVQGDFFTVTGNVLGINNAGSYPIVQVLSRDSVIVTGAMISVNDVNLNGNTTAVYVGEGVPYSGYKQVLLISAQPGAPTRNLVTFNTFAQYEKINQASGTQMVSLNKMNYNTAVQIGLDSYRYNTGLIAEANRIIYGDPRDPITYPGSGAAGADIFVREPLAVRVQVSLEIRLLTGVPFDTVAQQVQSSVEYLINSNPVGVSIDLSSVVSVARAVPGVVSVVVNSPLYNTSHDLIPLTPAEKAIIVDPTVDISISQIGS